MVDSSEVPGVGATRADFSTGNVLCAVGLVLDRCALADSPSYLELLRCEHFQLAEEAHLQLTFGV